MTEGPLARCVAVAAKRFLVIGARNREGMGAVGAGADARLLLLLLLLLGVGSGVFGGSGEASLFGAAALPPFPSTVPSRDAAAE